MDRLQEERNLDEAECTERKREWETLNNLFEAKDHIQLQQARNKWVREGDTNSSYFHKCVEIRGRAKEIKGFRINGRWLEGVQEVKEGVKHHFENSLPKIEYTVIL